MWECIPRLAILARTPKKTLHAMRQNKLSVLHWHLTDSQAFPFASAALPALGRGAWSPGEVC